MRAAGLLLAWALLHPAASQQCHPSSPGGVLRFTDRHAEIQVPALHRVPSSLDPLYGLVRRCLDLIQQNPLPTGEPRTGTRDPSAAEAGTSGGLPAAIAAPGAAPRVPRGSGRGFCLCPGAAARKVGDTSGGASSTCAMIYFAELLRTALNDPGSVRTSQVSRDMGRGNPVGMFSLGTRHPGTRSALSSV